MTAPATRTSPTLAAAARLLAGGGAEYPAEGVLAAVHRLGAAPPHETWNRALLWALEHEAASVQEAGVRACLARLDRLQADAPGAYHQFFDHLLDFCFMPRGMGGEAVQAHVLGELMGRLRGAPDFAHEPLRSRLLARARSLQHQPRHGPLAREILRGQWWMASEPPARSDTRAARRLHVRRRAEAYATPGVPTATLRAYLDQDRALGGDLVEQPLWTAYARLLDTHGQLGREAVVEQALSNLARWLAALPQTHAARRAATPDLVRARRNVAWEALGRPAALHLAAHGALLPGPEHAGDLLTLLTRRYAHPEGESVLAAGARVLRLLPGLRARLPEVTALLRRPALRGLGPRTWAALLDLAGSLVVGLPEAMPDSGGAEIAAEAAAEHRIAPRRARRLRSDLLAHDAALRAALLDLSRDDALPAAVREHAWRTLLRCGPPDAPRLFSDVLAQPAHPLFAPTLEEAGRARQRNVASVLARAWPHLTDGDAAAPGRRERLQRLCALFRRLRPYSLVGREAAGAVPPFLGLALDDVDPEVRAAAAAALDAAGYAAERQREQQRRAIESLHGALTRHTEAAARHEAALNDLADRARRHRARRDDLAHELEGLQEEHARCLAEARVRAEQQRVALHALDAELEATAARAREHEVALRALIAEAKTLREGEDLRRAPALEQRLARLRQEIPARQRQATEAAEAARRTRARLHALHTEPVPLVETEEESRAYRRHREQEQRALKDAAARHRRDAEAHQNQIVLLENELRETVLAMERATAQAQQLDALDGRIRAQQQAGQALHETLRRVEAKGLQLREEAEEARAEDARRLGDLTARLADRERALEESTTALQTAGDALARTQAALEQARDAARQAAHDLDHARRHYDDLSERAARESRRVDRHADAEQQRFEERRREAQESLIWYAYNIEQARVRRPDRIEDAP